jgi:hypothetical protein
VTASATATGEAAWNTATFRDAALAWVDAELSAHGLRRIGEPDERVRNWSAVYAVPTEAGRVWFKAEGPGQAFEVALYPLLQDITPDRVLHPLAVDLDRHWLLLPDGGLTLREAIGSDARAIVDAMVGFVSEYATLQLELMARVDDLLAIDVPDHRPATMPKRFDEALTCARPYVDRIQREGQESPGRWITGEVRTADEVVAAYEQVVAHRERFVEQCAVLADSPVPASIQHDDLHDGNVFATEPGVPRRFFDWGDAVVAHPFGTMLITVRILCELTGAGHDDEPVRRVRDAYLEPFTSYADQETLLTLLSTACEVTKVTRSLTWAREITTMPTEQAREWAPAQLGWLEELLVEEAIALVPDA